MTELNLRKCRDNSKFSILNIRQKHIYFRDLNILFIPSDNMILIR